MKSLLGAATLVAAVSAADPATFFGGTNNQAYLDWANSVTYDASYFMPSAVDEADGAAVHWTIKPEEGMVEIGVAVKATGWLGFGLSENGGMTGSDMMIFESAKADEGVWDAYVMSERFPQEDDCQDWKTVATATNGGFTTVQVTRKLVTGDLQDLPIVNDGDEGVPVSRIIAAWGDDAFGYHGQKVARGAIRWYSNEDEVTLFNAAMDADADGSFDLVQDNYPIKPIDTEYPEYCLTGNQLREKGVPIDAGTTLIGFDPIVNSEFVHHYLVFASTNENNNVTCSTQSYFELIYLWAPGEPPFYLPDFAGYSIGGTKESSFRSFLIQYHYDNPTLKDDGVDNSGIRFYYTNTPREHELGILQLGDPFLSLYGQEVGEGTADHTFDCPAGCSNIALTEPVNVVREVLHMHESGVTMSNAQSRAGQVIRTGKAEYFDFDQQGGHAVNQDPFTIEPGDSFKTDCVYANTGDHAGRTFGLASAQEMCIAYLFYYPRVGLAGGLPWACGGDTPFSEDCVANHAVASVASDADLDRSFGTAPSSCPAGAGGDGTTPGTEGTDPTSAAVKSEMVTVGAVIFALISVWF